MNSAAGRLPRLLALVPYLLARPGIAIDSAAADFGVSAEQLRKDLELLWMCGLPGYGPGDLIDLSFEADTVTVTFDAGMRRPLRLTGSEATAVLVGLRALAETPGLLDTDAIRRAIAKIESASGRAEGTGVVIDPGDEEVEVSDTRRVVQEALTSLHALRMCYYTASADRVGERVVDPMRMLIVDGYSYLEAWCRSAGGVRLFRLDRIDELSVLHEPAQVPRQAEPLEVSEGLFPARAEQAEAVLVLERAARWVAEYYACEELDELEQGKLRVRMRYAEESWMIRLLLGLGGGARVQSPAGLAARTRQRAQAAIARAGDGPHG